MHTGLLQIDRVTAALQPQRVARRVRLVECLDSTNAHLLRAVRDDQAGPDAPRDGDVLFAEHQSAGRGRMGRRWHAPRGAAVMCSTLLIDTPAQPLPAAAVMGLIAGFATVQAIRDVTGLDAGLAWPNDVIIDCRKVAGVLVESTVPRDRLRAYAVGIGINCLQHCNHFPPDLRDRATSLELAGDRSIPRESIAATLLQRLDAWFSAPQRWSAECIADGFAHLGRGVDKPVTLVHRDVRYTGTMLAIDPMAAIVVRLDDGTLARFPVAGTTIVHAHHCAGDASDHRDPRQVRP